MALASTFLASHGDGYDLQMGRWSRRLAQAFVGFTGIGAADRVLDVGCGTGSLSQCLAQTSGVVRIHGVDLSAAYIAHAKRNMADARLSFAVADACALPLADGSFDHTLSMLALQFIPRAAVAVREMRRVTRSGGTVAAATWDTRGGFVAFRMIFDSAAVLDLEGDVRRRQAYTRPMSRPGELARAWQEAGLIDVAQDMVTIRMEFSSFGDFWAPAEGDDGPVADYVRTLDPNTKARLRRAVELAYLDGESDGARSYAATAWVVKGTAP